MSERSPTLAHALRRALEAQSAALRVSLPGRVERFDPATQLADVKPLLHEVYELDTGDTETSSLPVITNVPVYSPGGQDFSLTMPVKAGDSCWLFFSDRSLDLWNENGGEQDPVDPRRHDLTDAICIVGVRPKATALSEYDADAIQMGKIGGVRVRVKSAAVHLGVDHNEDATDSVALASLVKNELEALKQKLESLTTAFNTHLHTVQTSGTPFVHTGVTTNVTPQAFPPNPVQDVKSNKVFSK